jgi:hypothetical protein
VRLPSGDEVPHIFHESRAYSPENFWPAVQKDFCNTMVQMQPRLFLPTARQANWLMVIGFLALGEALYLRYLAIEYATVALACQAGLKTWLCATFRLVIILFNHAVFGWIALAAALINVLRPSVVLVAIGLAAAGFGLVLHNADLSGLSVALLVVSLGRPAPAPE